MEFGEVFVLLEEKGLLLEAKLALPFEVVSQPIAEYTSEPVFVSSLLLLCP
jgi:hypothetical protein